MVVDLVNAPAHYRTGSIDVWDFILDQKLGYLEGNIVKYVCRAKHKDDELMDLEKAAACLARLIEEKKRAHVSVGWLAPE